MAIFVMMFGVACFAPALLISDVNATGVDFTVNNTNAILEMYIPASVTLNLLPSSGRAFDVQTLPIWIGTNSGAGYTLKMQTDSASLTRISSITDREGDKALPTIAPMTTVGSATGYTEEQFASDASDSDTLNRWGYKLSTSTNYIPITTNEITLSSTNAPSNVTNIEVDFAAKIDASQPTGLYATTLNFVAVTNNTNTAFTVNFDGNGLHFGNDSNNTVNVVTYDATRTSSQGVFYSCSNNFYYDDCNSDNGAPSSYNYSYDVNAISLDSAESTTVTIKYGLGSYNDGLITYPDYLFVLNGYYGDDGTISDTLYNVLVNVCNQDVNCAKERMALRNVELIDVFSGSAVDGDATVPITTSFGIDAANTSGLLPTLDPSNSGSLPVANSGITFVIAGFEQSTSNGYGYHAVIKQSGNFVANGLEKTVISGAYAEPVASSGVAEFLGWSEDPAATVPTYKNADEIIDNLNAVNGDAPVTLYAIYHHAEIEMQNLHPSLCTDAGTYVYDNRDNNVYLVKRLVDGRCWMLDNLALDLTDSDVESAMLDSTDTKTNASYQTLDYLFNGGGSSPYTNYAVANANSSNYYDRPAIAKSGTCNDAYCVNNPTSGNWTYDSVTQTTVNNVNSYAQGKIGIYYNFCAASAGSYCYTSGNAVDDPNTAIDAAEDICPSGWRMPTGGAISTSGYNNGGGEFQNLYNKYNNAKLFQEALSAPLSGYFYNGKAYYQGYYGGFWSSTWSNGNYMYDLYVYPTGVYPQDNYIRSYGFSMRCILNNTFMVEFNANGGTGTMSPQRIEQGVATALATNSFTAPTRTVFDGWNTMPDGSGVSYTDGQSVTDLVNVGGTITLYAQWKAFCTGYTIMQNLNSSNVDTILTGANSTAVACDVRDNQNYRIGRLADGKVWMLENLNLAGGITLSADDTDATSEYVSGFATGDNRLVGLGNAIRLPESQSTGFGLSSGSKAWIYNSGNKANCGAGQSTPCYSYYSWAAATLGGMQSDGFTMETRDGYNAAASICPKNWRLPTSTTSDATATSNGNWKTGDWYALATAYGVNLEDNYSQTDATFYNNAGPGTVPNFLTAGYQYMGGNNEPNYGYYWSATFSENGYYMSSYDFYFSPSGAGLGNVYSSMGRAVRCIMR